MLKHKIAELLEKAVAEAKEKGILPAVALPDIVVEHPQHPEHGDYASSLPLRLGRAARQNPVNIAHALATLLPTTEEVEKVSVAPPGFINFTLNAAWLRQQVEGVLAAGQDYGNIDLGQGQRVQVEFVSVNPTGPLHIGHGRGAVLGSTLANVLSSCGYQVEQEYYVNDAGSQIDAFFHSLYCRYLQSLGRECEMPADGYLGDYLVDLAREVSGEKGDSFLALPMEEAVAELGRLGLDRIIESIKEDLELLGVDFDIWFSEHSLYGGGQYDKVMSLLEKEGYLAHKEQALWFASTALGEDKDNVLVRSDGSPTYFASDIAYHYNKFLERGFDRVINIWGADHQGHVSRMKAAVAALGIDPQRLRIIISQMVTLRRGDALLKASKRRGELVTLRDLIDEVGADVCRFFFLARSADSQMDFDLELAKQQSVDNPVYYVQYAHARLASILRLAKERNIDYSQGDVALLTHPSELDLIRKMLLLPEIVELVGKTLEPQHLPHYAQDLATSLHSFYKQCRVVSQNQSLTWARLKLVKAAQIVFAKTLGLMGMTAPEKM